LLAHDQLEFDPGNKNAPGMTITFAANALLGATGFWRFGSLLGTLSSG